MATKHLFWIAVTLCLIMVWFAATNWRKIMPIINASAEEHTTFTVPMEYREVRAIIVRGDTTAEIVQAGGGTLLEERIIGGNLNVQRLPIFENWKIWQDSLLTIRSNNKWSNPEILLMSQSARFDTREMIIETELVEPTKTLGSYKTKMHIRPSPRNPGVTIISLSLWMHVTYRHLPLNHVEERVRKETHQEAIETLKDNERVLKIIIERDKGKYILIPR